MSDQATNILAEVAKCVEHQAEDRTACGRWLCKCLSGHAPQSDPISNHLLPGNPDRIFARGALVRAWFDLATRVPTDDDIVQLNGLWPAAPGLAADVRLSLGEPGRPAQPPLPSRPVPTTDSLAAVIGRLIRADPRSGDRASVAAAAIVERWRQAPLADDGLSWWGLIRERRLLPEGLVERWFQQVRQGPAWERIVRRLDAEAKATPIPGPGLLTTEEAAVRARCAIKTLNNWVSNRTVPPACVVGTGRNRRFKAAAFEAFLMNREPHHPT